MIEKGWSVREAERWAKKQDSARPKSSPPADPNVAAAIDRLRILLGTKVEIRGSSRRGHIRIHFFSQEDLIRIYSIISEKHRQDGSLQ
jgi:ParB family chromosome partitioning protein